MKGDKWICNDDFQGMNDISIKKDYILVEQEDGFVYYEDKIICGLKSYNSKQFLDKVEK